MRKCDPGCWLIALSSNANLLLRLEFLCSNCHTFATVYTNTNLLLLLSSSIGATTLCGFWPALQFRSTILYLYTSLSNFSLSSSSTCSSHLSLGLPTGLDEHGSHSISFLTVLIVSILITTPFFKPQYLEGQSNQPQKRDGKSDTTEAHTI
jgi:hypothetical protein